MLWEILKKVIENPRPWKRGSQEKLFSKGECLLKEVQPDAVRHSVAIREAEPWYRPHMDLRGCCTAIC